MVEAAALAGTAADDHWPRSSTRGLLLLVLLCAPRRQIDELLLHPGRTITAGLRQRWADHGALAGTLPAPDRLATRAGLHAR
eukprot:COSAG01_NODE_31108_length_603_cov_3.549603_1_plen_81_part_10